MKKNILFFTLVLILSSALISAAGCSRDEAVIQFSEANILQDPQTDIDNKLSEDVMIVPEDIGEPEPVTVYICGAVNHPGLYTFEGPSRVADAIEEAGGAGDDADLCYVNLATPLSDGQKVYIPTMDETKDLNKQLEQDSHDGVTVSGTVDSGTGLVNINTADEAALMTLPGIGEAKARLITEYRMTHGRFNSIEDIMKIKGIKEGMFNRIRDRICI